MPEQRCGTKHVALVYWLETEINAPDSLQRNKSFKLYMFSTEQFPWIASSQSPLFTCLARKPESVDLLDKSFKIHTHTHTFRQLFHQSFLSDAKALGWMKACNNKNIVNIARYLECDGLKRKCIWMESAASEKLANLIRLLFNTGSHTHIAGFLFPERTHFQCVSIRTNKMCNFQN